MVWLLYARVVLLAAIAALAACYVWAELTGRE
jgi:hypothetical protein